MEKISTSELEQFLKKANKNTYANKDALKTPPSRLKSEDYQFKEGELFYHDTYFGSRDFIGEEVVYKNDEPVWAMNYYGFVLKPEVSTNEAYTILRPALMQDDKGIIPVRGPRVYQEGEKKYQNKVEGDLSRFSGVEEILMSGEIVYRALYHGGFIE
ncbi:MAG TPA: DUF5680 domain-containing protein [Candidatus Paceibacterota bacterium]